MTTLRIFHNSAEATLVKTALENAGFTTFLHGENTFQNDFGIDVCLSLQIKDDQFEEAKHFLKGLDSDT